MDKGDSNSENMNYFTDDNTSGAWHWQPSWNPPEPVPYFPVETTTISFSPVISNPVPVKVIFYNNLVTVVYWSDGDKTSVKCTDGEEFSEEIGLAMSYVKKFAGNRSKFMKILKKSFHMESIRKQKKQDTEMEEQK